MDNLQQIQIDIQLGAMLITLGKATIDEIHGFFTSQGHDDEALAAIMTQVDARIARRS